MMSLRRRLIKGTALNLIAVVFNQGSTLIANILVACILIQQSFGEYAVLQATLLAVSPPFRSMTGDEDESIVAQINASGAGVVFVSLGCPKQEMWMAAHRDHIRAVMIGVGAAFDYHAGPIKRAPNWMQDSGLEWFHRLASEPWRLWKRYLVTNAVFVRGAVTQLWCEWSKSGKESL